MANAVMIVINIQDADAINREDSVTDNTPVLITTATPRLRQHHGRGGRRNVRAGEGGKKSSETLSSGCDCFKHELAVSGVSGTKSSPLKMPVWRRAGLLRLYP